MDMILLILCCNQNNYNYVLLKVLLPVCMNYTARGESPVANIA